MGLNKEKELKIMLTDILIDIQRVCDENKLSYYLVGGTLLGAVRHNGFIPWDDDIDIALPREDYEKFMHLEDQLRNNFIIVDYTKDNNYPYNFMKVENKNTTLIEEMYEHRGGKGGIYIDVFPLDGVPENKYIRKLHFISINFWKTMLILHYCNPQKERSKIKSFIVSMIKGLTNEKKIHQILDNRMKKYTYKDSKLVINYLGAYKEREMVDKEFFGRGQKVVFEKEEFNGPEKCDEYLKAIYGNYMKLPPKEKQISHHRIKYLNLKKPFTEYVKDV